MQNRKILIVSTGGLKYDGITNIIISYIESMDLTGLDIRITSTNKIDRRIEDKINALHCKIVQVPNRRKNTFLYFVSLTKYIREERIDVVHVHGNSCTLAIDLLAAKIGGAKKRIAHSHNTTCDQMRANKLLRPFFDRLYTDALACGKEAGKWLFMDKTYTILKNGRNIEKYRYDQRIRQEMRSKYNIVDELVVGHVGGFVEQKNHEFIIRLFKEILQIRPNAKMVLVGDGHLRSRIEEAVKDIRENFIFVGNTNMVQDYLQMMDVMVLPSLFEGLPLVLVEWQINGLPCLVSDSVTKECKFSKDTIYLDLDSTKEWIENICKYETDAGRGMRSEMNCETIKNAGFDIKCNAEKLRYLYLK